MFKKIIDFLLINTETEKTIKSTRTLILFVSLILAFCSSIMTAINIINKSELMLATTILLNASFLTCFFICLIKYNRKVVEGILCVTIIVLFSFYLIIGGNSGFAIDWILLVPIAYMTLFGVKNGLLVGGYFGILIIACFWTSVNSLLPFVYSSEVRIRYPVIYICCYLLAIVIGIRNKRLQINQIKNEERLSQAVLAERSRVEKISLDAVTSICHALDAKDTYTKEHSDHVAAYSDMIAQSLGWHGARLERLIMAAKVHDLGKIGIPDAILKKNGPLDESERSIMKTHVALGAEIVSDFTTMPELIVGAKYHHERYDGNGYSTGLSGEGIPIEGRIIALADAIDAMSSDRVYRKKRSKEFLVEELKSGSGKQFDPMLVKKAVTLIENGMLEQVNLQN